MVTSVVAGVSKPVIAATGVVLAGFAANALTGRPITARGALAWAGVLIILGIGSMTPLAMIANVFAYIAIVVVALNDIAEAVKTFL